MKRKCTGITAGFLLTSGPVFCQVPSSVGQSGNGLFFPGVGIGLALVGLLVYALYRAQRRQKVLVSQQMELEKQIEQLQQKAELQNTFLSVIRHDLRSSVASLKNELMLLKLKDRYLAELTPFEQYVNELYLRLDNIIYWSLIQRNELPYSPRLVDLADIMEEVITEFDGLIRQKKMVIKYDPQAAPRHIDEVLINLVLRNLLYCVIKVSEVNGIILITLRHDLVRTELHITAIGSGETSHEPLPKAGQQAPDLGLMLSVELMRRNQGRLLSKNEFTRQPSFSLSWP